MKISQSEVVAFRNCQEMHNFRFNRGFVPKDPKPSAAFRGTIVHKGLEVFYKHIREHGWKAYRDAAKLAMAELSRMVGEDPLNAMWYAEAMTILKNYFEYYQSDKEQYRVIAVEDEFEIVISGNMKAVLRVDLIVEYVAPGPLKGQIVLRDPKTTTDFWSEHKQEFNTQFPFYMYVINKLFNYNMEYMELQQLRTRKMKAPTFDQLFQRNTLFFSRTEQETVFNEFVTTANEIKFRRTNPHMASPTTRNPEYRWCESCEYAIPCKLQRRGRIEDAESFLEFEYTTDDKYSYGEKF